MKFSKLLLVLVLLFSLTISCDNEPLGPTRDIEEEVVDPAPDPDPVDPIPEPSGIDISETFGNEVQRSFLGSVIDINENPVSNVDIRIGNSSTSTDSNGVFIINDATIKENFGYITASKTGYIQGSRSIVPTTGTNKVTIMLLDETIIGSTSSGIEATITLPNNASVKLSGDYIKEDGSAYQGNVDIIMHHLDPTDPNMEAQMPGMLFAANANNEAQVLKSFGMLAIELRGTGGEKLNLAENTTAEIEVPVPAELMADAPSTIPLWYFDEEEGYWKEEGEAQLFGNTYIGSVTHFSFWNYDIQAEPVRLCITVVDENNNPIANHIVQLTSANFGTSTGTTNTSGETCGYVPREESLTLNILNYAICGNEVIHTETIGPFSSNADIIVIVSSNSNLIAETVTGRFNDCNGSLVTDGYVILTYGGQQFADQITNGIFEINFFRCEVDTTFTIQAYDYNSQQTTGLINYGFTTSTTNLGTITACDAFTEFITYQIGNNTPITYTTNIINNADPFNQGGFFIGASEIANNGYYFNFTIETQIPGTYDYTDYSVEIDVRDSNGDQEIISYNYNITVSISNFGETGEYIDVNFSGTFGGSQTPISGTIHIIRDF